MSFSPVPSFEKADCVGEVGPFDPKLAMLASVDVLSRPDDQFVENTDGPNGPPVDCCVVDEKLEMCCGTDPARRRDRSAALFEAELWWSPISPSPGEGDLYGVGDGDVREVFDTSDASVPGPPRGPPGENRDGTVPARARRPCGRPSEVIGSCM
jgi:hypothetical protein